MTQLLLWIGLGAIFGSLVGIYRCADMNKASPGHTRVVHIGLCAAAGAVGGSVLFLLVGGVFYGTGAFFF